MGQYVVPGVAVLTLADDSILEIPVKLDARDARQWLGFNGTVQAPGVAWFREPEHVKCRIRWSEEVNGHAWEGTLHRVEQFDPATRTLTVVIRVPGAAALSADGDGLPLVAGMFCEVVIPGRTMHGVYGLPHWAVNMDGTVLLAKGGRLKTVPVRVLRTEGETAYISEGLEPDDVVITTRLINPLDNTLLDVHLEGEAKRAGSPAAGS